MVRAALTNCEDKVTFSERSYARGQFGHLDEFCPGRRFLVILETPGQLRYISKDDAVNVTCTVAKTMQKQALKRVGGALQL